MNETTQTSYDELPYGSNAFVQTHPDRLAATALLFGLSPPKPETCRVLELGCASGGNLLPMASQMPSASFLGIDLSARQIEAGNAIVEQLGLSNIELKQMDLMKVDESIGRFDYIIAHGVFSWIPARVQDHLLSICKNNLVPNGVAYVSYNTNPGWRMRGMVRDMMLYHTKQFAVTGTRVQQARALLDFLSQNVPTENNAYGIMLRQEVEVLRSAADSYLFHEHLEDVNEPIYFHEFAERAAKQGLQYLGESEFHTMLSSNFPNQVKDTLKMIAPDIIRTEQYMDFLRNRVFRQTLLVHQNAPINRNLDWRSIQPLYLGSLAKPKNPNPDIRSTAVEEFVTPLGATLNTPSQIVKAALLTLAQTWPRAITFKEIRDEARTRLYGNTPYASDPERDARDELTLGTEILQCIGAGIVEMRARAPAFTTTIHERPQVSALTRQEATQGSRVTNLRHESTGLDEFNRQLVRHLDGKRDRAELLVILERLVKEGMLAIHQEGRAVTEPASVRAVLEKAYDDNIVRLAGAALLEQPT